MRMPANIMFLAFAGLFAVAAEAGSSSATTPTYVCESHPIIDKILRSNDSESRSGMYSFPSVAHPIVEELFSGQLPSGHPNVDAILSEGRQYPVGHVNISEYVVRTSKCYQGSDAPTCVVQISPNHPPIDSNLLSAASLPEGHPGLQALLESVLPTGHPNLDALSDAGIPLPDGHPSVGAFACKPGPTAGFILAMICAALLVVATVFRAFHSSFKKCFEIVSSRRKGGRLAAAGASKSFVQSSTAPLVDSEDPGIGAVHTGDLEDRDGEGCIVSGFVDKRGHRVGNVSASDRKNSMSTVGEEDTFAADGKVASDERERRPTDDEKRGGFEAQDRCSPSQMFRRRAFSSASSNPAPNRCLMKHGASVKHSAHRNALYDYDEVYDSAPLPCQGSTTSDPLVNQDSTAVGGGLGINEPDADGDGGQNKGSHGLRAYASSLSARLRFLLCQARIPCTDISAGDAVIVCSFLGVALMCLFTNSDKSVGRGWGSLAAATTMILIVPATRNSVLSWLLNVPFDRIVGYHRMLGRFVIFFAVMHTVYMLRAKPGYPAPSLTWNWGWWALACLFVIFLTTFNIVRRRLFNVFYWTHYSFVGFFVFSWLHVPQTHWFLGVGAGLYVLDKLLRIVRMGIPGRMLVFKLKGRHTAQVRFQKNAITRLLNLHRVGNYYFVNFPDLSLTEWHPFSVTSSPTEDTVELHIRALGDHTADIVKFAKQVEEDKSGKPLPYIKIDGPYGIQNFNYRRYPVVILTGGGIGIAPVIGMLKDIYKVGVYGEPEGSKPKPGKHANETIYFVWAMRSLDDYELFGEELGQCMDRAQEGKGFPPLVCFVHVTKPDGPLPFPLIEGRPDFKDLLFNVTDDHPGKSGLVFTCGPRAMVNQLWDECLQVTIGSQRFDFHHEIFEF